MGLGAMQINKIQNNLAFTKNTDKKSKNSRTGAIVGGFGLSTVVADVFLNNLATKAIMKNTKTKMHPLTVSSIVTFAAVGVSMLAGALFGLYDKNHPTKIGDFFNKYLGKKPANNSDN